MRMPFILCLTFFATTVAAQEMRTVTGALTYRERIALTETAEVVVVATDRNGMLLAESRTSAGGAQVPLPFSLALAGSAEATVSAMIVGGIGQHWVSAPMPVSGDGADADLGEMVLAAHRPLIFDGDYLCGETRIRTAWSEETLLLEAGPDWHFLSRAPSGSGARYAGDGVEVRTKGPGVLVAFGGESLPECRIMPPPYDETLDLTGADGWSASLSAGRLEIQGIDDAVEGGNSVSADVEADRVVFQAGDAMVSLTRALCRAGTVRSPFPLTASLETGGETFPGCAGDPADLLAGSWRVIELAGDAVPDDAEITLNVGEASVGGNSGCNVYGGDLKLEEGTLSVSQVFSTFRACEEPLLSRERALFAGLGAAVAFDIGPEGGLFLVSEDGAAVLRAVRIVG